MVTMLTQNARINQHPVRKSHAIYVIARALPPAKNKTKLKLAFKNVTSNLWQQLTVVIVMHSVKVI